MLQIASMDIVAPTIDFAEMHAWVAVRVEIAAVRHSVGAIRDADGRAVSMAVAASAAPAGRAARADGATGSTAPNVKAEHV